MKNKLLSIVIPTYNRAELLNITLANLIDTIKYLDLEVIVSDNASPDHTEAIVKSHIKNYSGLKYFRQCTNVGYDRNVMNCYQLATSDYIWILGDSYGIVKDHLALIVSILEKKTFQGVVFNSFNRIKNIPSKTYSNPSEILAELGWHMTYLNSFIIPKEFVNLVTLKRYYDTYYFHLGVFFENIVLYDNLRICWMEDNVIVHTKFDASTGIERSGGWFRQIFSVFGTHLFSLIMSLPNQISIEAKLKCIKDHDLNTNVFNLKRLFRLRANGISTREDFNNNKMFLSFFTDISIWKIKLVYYTPVFILQKIKFIYKKLV